MTLLDCLPVARRTRSPIVGHLCSRILAAGVVVVVVAADDDDFADRMQLNDACPFLECHYHNCRPLPFPHHNLPNHLHHQRPRQYHEGSYGHHDEAWIFYVSWMVQASVLNGEFSVASVEPISMVLSSAREGSYLSNRYTPNNSYVKV